MISDYRQHFWSHPCTVATILMSYTNAVSQIRNRAVRIKLFAAQVLCQLSNREIEYTTDTGSTY